MCECNLCKASRERDRKYFLNPYNTVIPEQRIDGNDYAYDTDCAVPDVIITDQRDIDEINRRKQAKTCGPGRDELYSVNPNFNGIYTGPGKLE